MSKEAAERVTVPGGVSSGFAFHGMAGSIFQFVSWGEQAEKAGRDGD